MKYKTFICRPMFVENPWSTFLLSLLDSKLQMKDQEMSNTILEHILKGLTEQQIKMSGIKQHFIFL